MNGQSSGKVTRMPEALPGRAPASVRPIARMGAAAAARLAHVSPPPVRAASAACPLHH